MHEDAGMVMLCLELSLQLDVPTENSIQIDVFSSDSSAIGLQLLFN